MKFHFDGYALCEIGENDGEPIARLLGIFQSRRDMAPYVRNVAVADMKADKDYWQHWGFPSAYYREPHVYVVVPIGEVSGSCLFDIQEKIEQAALLLAKGYGKTVAA